MKPERDSHPEPTLLFIPDISGFTKFIHETEAQHSQHIIEELLEVLIDANEIDLEISEIEGDAILFYRTGKTPTAIEILAQVQKMYEKFHLHLKKYETQRICQCGACVGANSLELKFIIHYGDIAKKQVKSYTKLFGKDVIVAHRLMKNDIENSEYVLVTHQLLNSCSSWVDLEQAGWEPPSHGESTYDFGEVKYCYLSLEPLKHLVPEPTIQDYALSDKMMRAAQVEKVIQAPIEMVFDVISDVSAKHLWVLGVQDSDRINHKIIQNGVTHRCVMGQQENDPAFVSHGFDVNPDKITWTDTDHRTNTSLVIRLRRVGDQLTRVSITVMTKYHIIKRIIMAISKGNKKLVQFFSGSLEKLADHCHDLVREDSRHPSNILIEPASQPVAS